MIKVVALLLVIVLTISISSNLFFYSNNQSLSKQVLGLKEEIQVLNSANLTTALGIIEIPPYTEGNWWGNNYSYVWITGWVFNYGASMAKNAGLQVLAHDKADDILMNYTVPIVGYGVFSANEDKSLLPDYLQLAPLEFGNVLSQENATVRLSIFHEGNFKNDTTYEAIPIYDNALAP
jgi:hypothetical protein